MIVCGLPEWKLFCAGFFIVSLYLYCGWRSKYKKWGIVIPLTALTHHNFVPVPSQDLNVDPSAYMYAMVFLCSQI